MTEQLDLLTSHAYLRADAHDTEVEAAVAMIPDSATLRGRVYIHIVEQGVDGATDEETQYMLNMNPSTQRPRRLELVAAGLVTDSGQRRATRSGRNAIVWVAR